MAHRMAGARVAAACALAGALLSGSTRAYGSLCPNGAYVSRGPCTLCPDGSYVAAGALCIVTPVGGYASTSVRHPAAGTGIPPYRTLHTILCPDGSRVSGNRCVLTPQGRYTGG